MAIYKIQDPNTGKTVTLEGDTPPSEQDLDEIFSQINTSEMPEMEQQPSGLEDAAKSFISGLSEIPRGAANISNKYLRPALTGKQPLSQQELDEMLGAISANRYDAKTDIGKAAGFAGAVAPTIAMGGTSIPAQIGVGGLIGATNAANNNQNFVAGGITGAGFGAAGGLALKGLGKLAPIVAEKMSGIPKSVYNEALANPYFFTGKWDKNTINRTLSELEKEYGEQVGKTVRDLPEATQIPLSTVQGTIDDIISNSFKGADVSAEYSSARKIIDDAYDEFILEPSLRSAGVPEALIKEEIQALKSGVVAKQTETEASRVYKAIKQASPEKTEEQIAREMLDKWNYSAQEIENAKNATININNLKVKPANLHQFKEKIQSKINFDTPESNLQARILKPIQGEAATLIENRSPEYKQANELYSVLKESLKKDSKLKNIKNAQKTANRDIEEAVNNKLLDVLRSSKNAKDFTKELNKLNQRGYFEQFAPHKVDVKPVGSGNALASIYTLPSAASGNFVPLLLQLITNLGVSPMAQRGVVEAQKAGAKVSPYYTRLLQQAMNSSTRPREAK